MPEIIQKPAGLTPQYAAQFQDSAIVCAYRYREPYSPQIYSILRDLTRAPVERVLDLGCGSGDFTKGLAAWAQKVDALDPSSAMLTEARRCIRAANIQWIEGAAETTSLEGPYDLVTAAQSFHWMDWQMMALRLKAWLRPGAFLALIARGYHEATWWDSELQAVIDKYSTNREFQRYELVSELEKTGLYRVVGKQKTDVLQFEQPVTDLVESFHSRNGFSRDRMSVEAAKGFDREATELLSRFARNGSMPLKAISQVTWLTVN